MSLFDAACYKLIEAYWWVRHKAQDLLDYHFEKEWFIRVDGFDEFTSREDKVTYYAAVGTYLPARRTSTQIRGDRLWQLVNRPYGVYVRELVEPGYNEGVCDPDGTFSAHFITPAKAAAFNRKVDPYIPY